MAPVDNSIFHDSDGLVDSSDALTMDDGDRVSSCVLESPLRS
jgi:hypothetical protein